MEVEEPFEEGHRLPGRALVALPFLAFGFPSIEDSNPVRIGVERNNLRFPVFPYSVDGQTVINMAGESLPTQEEPIAKYRGR